MFSEAELIVIWGISHSARGRHPTLGILHAGLFTVLQPYVRANLERQMSELLGKTKLGVSLYLTHGPWNFMSPSDPWFLLGDEV